MAALSLAGQADRHAFVTAFAGEHHYVADYLVEEVLSRQPEAVQTFLMSTSVLDRMTAPLCASVTGQADAHALLEQIERSNLFLVPLDDERRWFRYHHLFADLLRARLRRLRPDWVPVLYARASQWHEAAADALPAVHYALAGGDHDRAARLVEQNVHDWWGLAQSDFLRLLSRLPDAVIRSRPALAVYQAWVCIITGRPNAAVPLLAAAEAGPESGRTALGSFAALMRTYVMELTGQPYELSPLVCEAPRQIPETQVAMRNSADVILALILYINGDLEQAAALLTAAAARDAAANLTDARPVALSRLARIRMLQGRLPEAEALCRRHLERFEDDEADRHFVNGSLHAALADVLREQNDLAGAEAQAREAIAQNEAWQIPEALAAAHLQAARIRLARGDLDGAAHALTEAEACSRGRTLATDLVQLSLSLQVRLWLAGGNLSAARRWAERHGQNDAEPVSFRREPEQMALARIRLAEGRWADARALLERLAGAAAAGKRIGRLIEIKALQALALRQDEPEAALAVLEEALVLAEAAGYVRTFLDEGSQLADLLRTLAGRPGPAQAYARRLLSAAAGDPQPAPPTGLLEPLTDRELEVLHLLADGLSNQELAARLTVTYGTIKTHVHHIYEKLGTGSRTRAIARARELHLLETQNLSADR
jgi:LuxR family maltose regulon positive regulatory protein